MGVGARLPAVQILPALILALLHVAHQATADADSPSPVDLRRDIVIAIPSCVRHLEHFVYATRPFRKGIRTFITLEDGKAVNKQNALIVRQTQPAVYPETYAHLPDNAVTRHRKKGLHEGRWLLTPFLAHRQYRGAYKWMLLGDDDTLWLLTGVRHLLAPYDPSLPYWISDAVAELQSWVGDPTPRMTMGKAGTGTLCLPCHTPAAVIKRLSKRYPERSAARALDWKGCPCTAQQGCAHRSASCQLPGACERLNRTFVGDGLVCGVATHAYGGAGMILSAAMLDALPEDEARKLAPTLYIWADWELAQLMQSSGFALTYTETSAVMGSVLDQRRFKLFGHDMLPQLLDTSDGLDRCHRFYGRHCNWTLAHAVSSHLGGRHRGDWELLPQRLRSMAGLLLEAMRSMGLERDHLEPA